jgi:hypothetical protein
MIKTRAQPSYVFFFSYEPPNYSQKLYRFIHSPKQENRNILWKTFKMIKWN